MRSSTEWVRLVPRTNEELRRKVEEWVTERADWEPSRLVQSAAANFRMDYEPKWLYDLVRRVSTYVS